MATQETITQTTVQERSWAGVDLNALRHNVQAVQSALPNSFNIVAVVKADAYGHGASMTALTLEGIGIQHFAVANVQEGAALRRAGITGTILVLSPLLSHEDSMLAPHTLTPLVSSLAEVERFAQAAEDTPLTVHLKVDTGMGRSGALPKDAQAIYAAIQANPKLRLTGICTHYSSARTDLDYTYGQRQAFLDWLEAAAADTSGLMIHSDNSQAVIRLEQEAPFNAIRLGLLAYGHPESVTIQRQTLELKPVLSLHGRIVSLKTLPEGASVGYHRLHILKRPSRMALIACGYGDGIPMGLTNRGYVLVRGQRAPICGLVAMDIVCIDVTDIEGVALEDTVTFLGKQGNERIDLETFCERSGRAYREVSCLLTQRMKRIYLDQLENHA